MKECVNDFNTELPTNCEDCHYQSCCYQCENVTCEKICSFATAFHSFVQEFQDKSLTDILKRLNEIVVMLTEDKPEGIEVDAIIHVLNMKLRK